MLGLLVTADDFRRVIPEPWCTAKIVRFRTEKKSAHAY